VLATARSEAVQWKLLDFDEKDKLWGRFGRIELPEPADSAIVSLLDDNTKQAGVKDNPEEYEAIARRNDGSYRNIMLNLRRWEAQNKPVSKDDFSETLHGSWRDIYEAALARHPAVRYIYDAIDVLRQAEVELFPFLIQPMAVTLWGGSRVQRFLRRRQILHAMQYLSNDTNILRSAKGKLTPSDGQIEARDRTISWTEYDKSLIRLLLKHSSQSTAASLFNLAGKFYYQKDFDQSLQLISRLKKLKPASPAAHNATGVLLDELKRYDEAEAAYRKAIELNPDEATAYSNLGNLLSDENLKRYDEAEAAYRKAIELNPPLDFAHVNLGQLYFDLGKPQEAINILTEAIKLSLESARCYRQRGIIYQTIGDLETALDDYKKAIELQPDYGIVRMSLFGLLKKLGRNDEAKEHESLAREFAKTESEYNRACFESLCGNTQEALSLLEIALEKGNSSKEWARQDPDLENIRDDPRFKELVGE
jgi:tetratricopeptide (TPR) repeat protein